MKTRKWIFLILFLFAPFIFFPNLSISEEPVLGGVRISLIQGRVLVQTGDGGERTEASVNFPVVDGDRIMTSGDGRAELHFKNGTYVRMGEGSRLEVIASNFDPGKTFVHLHHRQGKIYVNHRPPAREVSSLFVVLPFGVLSSYVPSRFRIDLTSSDVRISILEGSVEFKREGRPIPLAHGKTLIVGEEGYTEAGRLYERDEWDRWNEARDRGLIQRRYTQAYLPPELEPWGYEMEGYGRWVYVPEYQYVWVPRVAVRWVPFSNGYWIGRGVAYCWIPYEAWGWIPFHYGRWVHIHLHGWVWVPPPRHAVSWHPGAVGWHIGPNHISWVPLAPGEIDDGHGYNRPGPVNTNYQKKVFINARVKEAVVTVQRDSFLKRTPIRGTQKETPFIRTVKSPIPPAQKPPVQIVTPSPPVLSQPSKTKPETIEKAREDRRGERISAVQETVNDSKGRINSQVLNRETHEKVPSKLRKDQEKGIPAVEKKDKGRAEPLVPAQERVRGKEISNPSVQEGIAQKSSKPLPLRDEGQERKSLKEERVFSPQNSKRPVSQQSRGTGEGISMGVQGMSSH